MLLIGLYNLPCGSRREKNRGFWENFFMKKPRGAPVTLAWSLAQPRHLFVFGSHGATWTRGNSASGRVEVKVGVGASWDGIRGAVAPNAGVSQGSGTARHCLRAAAPNQALRGKRGQPRLFTLLRQTVRPFFSRPPHKEDLVCLAPAAAKISAGRQDRRFR